MTTEQRNPGTVVEVSFPRQGLQIEGVLDVEYHREHVLVVTERGEYVIPYAGMLYLSVYGPTLSSRRRAANRVPGRPDLQHMVDVVDEQPR